MTKRIYLAGKIGRNDWRHELVPGLGDTMSGEFSDFPGAASLPELSMASVGPGFLYTGPYFVRCDHVSAHIPGTHGCGAWFDFELDGEDLEARRFGVYANCLQQIRKSDLVFAWLDQPGAHASCWELAWAKAHRIKTAVAMPSNRPDLCNEYWFVAMAADLKIRSKPSALPALLQAIDTFWPTKPVDLSQSPIESAMVDALLAASDFQPARGGDSNERARSNALGCSLFQQYPVGPYALDVALIRENGPRVCIECDGHDYHERTKEQARHDKARDRFLVEQGWTVLRFTGSEIHNNAAACAEQAIRIFTGKVSA